MTRTIHLTKVVRRWAAPLAIGAIVATSGLATNAVDAARRTQSEVIAGEAARATAALERWDATRSPVDYVRFVRARDSAAVLVASELAVDGDQLAQAWSSVSVDKQHALLAAMSQLGVPYRSIASEPGVGFDCSGLTIYAFEAAGLDIPRVSSDQINNAVKVDAEDAEAGDLVFYPGHISIYLGLDLMVHSPNSGSFVEVADLPDKSVRFGDAVASAERVTDSRD